MRFLRHLLLLMLATLWLPATLHCDLEAAGLSLVGHEEVHGALCASTCAGDECNTVEGASYRHAEDTLRLPPLLPQSCHCLCCLALLLPPEPVRVVLPALPPEAERVRTCWVFHRRLAPAPRAPSRFLS